MAVTKGNKCSGESDFAEEKVDTLANPVPFVANPVSDVKVHLLQTAHHYYASKEEIHKYLPVVTSDNQ